MIMIDVTVNQGMTLILISMILTVVFGLLIIKYSDSKRD